MSEVSEDRSALMRRIRRSDTKPEMVLRRRLWANGMRYRVDYRTTVGRVDIVFPGPQVAVFVDGCFWHGCPEHYVRPRSRQTFWSDKLRSNVARDRRQTLKLEAEGWRVLRFWEHEVFTDLDEIVSEVQSAVSGEQSSVRPRWHVVDVEPVSDGEGEVELRKEERLRNADQSRQSTRRRSTRKW